MRLSLPEMNRYFFSICIFLSFTCVSNRNKCNKRFYCMNHEIIFLSHQIFIKWQKYKSSPCENASLFIFIELLIGVHLIYRTIVAHRQDESFDALNTLSMSHGIFIEMRLCNISSFSCISSLFCIFVAFFRFADTCIQTHMPAIEPMQRDLLIVWWS